MKRAFRQSASSVGVVAVALAIVAALLLILGASPLEVARVIAGNVFGSAEGVAYALFYATPLIFTGLAVAVAFRAGLFNIGAEGQLYLAAFAAAVVGAHVGGLPAALALTLTFLAGVVAGGVWGGIAGAIRAYRGAHEVIATIMMNFIAIGMTTYWATYAFREPDQAIPQTRLIEESVYLSRASAWLQQAGESAHSIGWHGIARAFEDGPLALRGHVPLNGMFIVAVVACIAIAWALRFTVWGYTLDAVGRNPEAAAAAGIPVRRTLAIAMIVSGCLAAGAGLNEVLGHSHRFIYAFSSGLGFLGIAVALLGRNSPLGVFLAALFFGMLVRGGLFLDLFVERVDKDVVFVLQGMLIWGVGLSGALRTSVARGWGRTAVGA